jgi:hypothetical protein
MTDRNLVAVVKLVDQIGPALQRNDRAGLNDIIGKLIALDAPMGGQWEQLAYLAAGNGEIGLARKAIDLFAEASGGAATGQYRKAALLFDLGFPQEADLLLRAVPDNVPDRVSHAYSRAVASLSLGASDEARLCLDRVTSMKPQLASAWLLLSQSVNLAREPELADRIIAAGRDLQDAPSGDRGLYLYALGKVHADRGEHALAFDAFAQGALQMKTVVRLDSARDRQEAAEAVRGYDAERIAEISRAQREPTGRTIFVTGLPRSGTTLVEQILTSHSAVGNGGEINLLGLLAREVGGQSLPALSAYVNRGGSAPAARLWQHWLDERFPGPGRVVNKAVDTSRFLGLAAALLPEAPLIWMTRDPLDRAWSCFRTSFLGDSMAWSYDLKEIAAHFRLEDQLLARWQEILGDRLLVVQYESLIDEPTMWIRRILAHCDLAEEPRVFTPHENRRPVATASVTQVRRPINRDGIGAAEPYRPLLQPFVDAYYD